MNRLVSLPALRGISAMLIVLFHFVIGIPDYFPPHLWVTKMAGYGYVGVYIFFLISGLIIPYALHQASYKVTSFFRFLLKRILRIEPIYWVNICFVIFISYLLYLLTSDSSRLLHITYDTIFFNLIHLAGFVSNGWMNVIYWTLSVEMQYYIWIGLLFPVLIHSNKYIGLIYILLFASIGWYSKHHDFLFTYAAIFSLGNLLFLFLIKRIEMHWFLLLGSYLLFQVSVQEGWPVFMSIFCTLILIVINWKGFNGLNFLGEISYSIYLFHLPIGIRFINYGYANYSDMGMRTVFLILAIGSSILTSWIFYKLVELPSLRWSKKINY